MSIMSEEFADEALLDDVDGENGGGGGISAAGDVSNMSGDDPVSDEKRQRRTKAKCDAVTC